MGWLRTFTLAGGLASLAGAAAAQDGERHMAKEWQLGFQDAASPVMHEIRWFHDSLLLPIITVITLFVLGLLIYVMFRFNEKSNPTPSKTTHNTLLEVIWTAVPIAILMVIAIPSFPLLYQQDKAVDADMTIKAIGNQWYWTYEYPDHGNFVFDANMVADENLNGRPRLLATDNEVVVPVDKVIRVLVTATDVIHNWAIPSFAVKMDGVPGRINETWFKAEKVGTYYGQCSELCGVRHGFMPITVRVVSDADFAAWVEEAKAKFAAIPAKPSTLAAVRE
jgi:cytochrome c oxidase subunit 2